MAKKVRITGLVKVADWVRKALAEPMTAGRREDIRARVGENLQIVHNSVREARAAVTDLPPPTQRAYRFLAGLDWSKVAVVSDDPHAPPATPRTIISWPGMSAFLERMCERLAVEVSDAELSQIRDKLSTTSRRMEMRIERDSVSPDRLTPPTRVQRGWLAFFSLPENLQTYVQARRCASRAIDAAAVDSKHFPPPISIHFRPLNGLYKLHIAHGRPLLWLPTPMFAWDQAAFETLSKRIFRTSTESRRQVIELMTGEGYQAVRAELDALGGIVEQSRGAAHDLSASFIRVNAGYFGGTIARPRLTWNRTFTGRKFGHYDWIQDTVMVSSTLDSSDVPEYVVDFLMFHELLHKYHGLHWVNGRGYAHTSEFQRDERKFSRYAEAEAVLSRPARSVR